MKWDNRFLRLAKEISTWSKDPSKKIGAIYVSKDRRILATGYNGFPRRIIDTQERYNNRSEKYKFVAHAEMNGIYNATYSGTSLRESTLYVYGLPVCFECAKGVMQAGVERVIMTAPINIDDQWSDSWKVSAELFKEAGIEWDFVDEKDIYYD